MNVAEAQTYNGWTNYETWLVNLWITGDEGYYSRFQEIVSFGDSLDDQAEALEDFLRSEHDGYSSVWADLVNASLSEVNWYEIVEMNQE